LSGQVLISESEIKRIFAVSKSRGNFAALLVQQMYARHERITSNVMGTRGKRQLSPRRMAVVRRLSFRMYPAANEREEETIWKKECVKAIDSKNRKVRINPASMVSRPRPTLPPAMAAAAAAAAAAAVNEQQQQRSVNSQPSSSSPAAANSASAVAAMAAAMAAAAAAGLLPTKSAAVNRSPPNDKHLLHHHHPFHAALSQLNDLSGKQQDGAPIMAEANFS
jgi:hypothetical protein